MQFRNQRVRLLLGGAALASFALLPACSSDSGDASQSSTAGSSIVAASTTAPPSTISSSIDAVALLKQAVAGLGNGYHYASVFTVNGAVSVTAEGDRIGNDSRFTITSGGAAVNYLITATGSYAQPENGDWQLLDQPPASTDPILSLAAPQAIGVLEENGTSIRLRVTVSAATLGIAQDGTADLDVLIVDGAFSQIGYTATTAEGVVASVSTTIGPVADATPITAPA